MSKKAKIELSDEELVRQIREGINVDYFEVLYKRYYPKVVDKCYALLKDKEVARECGADVLTKAYEKLPGFNLQSSFSSWLYVITYNYCIDYLRRYKKMHYPKWNASHELPEIIDEDDESWTDGDVDLLMKILDEIHPEEKALILMKYQDDLSIKDICVALQISESAVKMRLKRAKTRVMFFYKEQSDLNN